MAKTRIDTTIRRWCGVCQRATVSAICSVGHSPVECCTGHLAGCPYCQMTISDEYRPNP